MWFITEETSAGSGGGQPTHLAPCYWFGGIDAPPRTIGRKNVDIRLRSPSVSRTHATVRVKPSSFQQQTDNTIPTVQDSSAYGTFLKYPAGHSAIRGTRNDGHHDRLDKDTPVEVYDGALLAFGAPSVWWRVSWMPIRVFPFKLPDRIGHKMKCVQERTGLALMNPDVDSCTDATHVVVNQFRVGEEGILRCVVHGVEIVSHSWVMGVDLMVKEQEDSSKNCQMLNVDHGNTTTHLSLLPKHRPQACPEDVRRFGGDTIIKAFDTALDRTQMFREVVFLFTSEFLLEDWFSVLTDCGGTALFYQNKPDDSINAVYVTTTGVRTCESSKEYVRLPPGAPACSEDDIVRAILTGDSTPIQTLCSRDPFSPVDVEYALSNLTSRKAVDSDAETTDHDQLPVADQNDDCERPRNKRPRRSSLGTTSVTDAAKTGPVLATNTTSAGALADVFIANSEADHEGQGEAGQRRDEDGNAHERVDCADSVLSRGGASRNQVVCKLPMPDAVCVSSAVGDSGTPHAPMLAESLQEARVRVITANNRDAVAPSPRSNRGIWVQHLREDKELATKEKMVLVPAMMDDAPPKDIVGNRESVRISSKDMKMRRYFTRHEDAAKARPHVVRADDQISGSGERSSPPVGALASDRFLDVRRFKPKNVPSAGRLRVEKSSAAPRVTGSTSSSVRGSRKRGSKAVEDDDDDDPVGVAGLSEHGDDCPESGVVEVDIPLRSKRPRRGNNASSRGRLPGESDPTPSRSRSRSPGQRRHRIAGDNRLQVLPRHS